MAKIPFTLEAWLKDKSQKVETRDGRPARIICTDAKADDDACIIALIPGYGGEEAYQFFPDGRSFSSKSSDEDCADLFLVTPEPELTEFEKALESFYNHHLQVCTYDNQGTVEDSLHDGASKLIAIARKQLQPEIDAEIEKAYKTADEVQYKKGREDLLQELFKDSSTEELEKELKIFHDIFKNKDCSASAIRNWAQLFRTVAQKEYFVKTNLTASETIKEDIRTEYEKGRADVLKDLPRWKKCNPNTIYRTECSLIVNGIGRYIILDGYMIDVDRLKKLPGFKDDE